MGNVDFADLKRKAFDAYNNHTLTVFLKGLNTEQLNFLERLIMCDDVVDHCKNILDSLNQEREYRVLDAVLTKDTDEFITVNYKHLLKNIELDDLYNSILYYNYNGIDYNYLIKWVPVFLSVKETYILYNFFKQQGYSDIEILDLFGRDLEEIRKIYKRINGLDKYLEFEEQFKRLNSYNLNGLIDENYKRFVLNSVEDIKKNKAKTESYEKYVDKIMNDDDGIMRRLM